MKYINISNTDLSVSQIALGMMRIAEKSVDEVEELVQTALNLGINFFDHADLYGLGKSEELFGEVLKRHPDWREKMIIQTKSSIAFGYYDSSREHILNSVENSLKRMNTDHIDILLLHRPDALADPKEIAETFNCLQQSGKVRYFGVSNHTPNQIELLKKYVRQPIIINQLQFSIVHSGMIDSGIFANMKQQYAIDKDGGVLDYCRINDITIQAWSILQASWEEGTFINNPDYQKLNDTLEEIGNKYGLSKNAAAVAWILRHPADIQAIAGTTSPIHLSEICKAAEVQLSREEWYRIYLSTEKPLP